jgi:hypothetical protein
MNEWLAIEGRRPNPAEPPQRSYWDPKSGCRFVAATPAARPDLWVAYLAGAVTNYRRHGVEKVVEYDHIRDGESTSLFFAALDGSNRVVAGMRAQGPYVTAEQSHAMIEWTGHEGQRDVRKLISDRIPFGAVEMKTGWVSDSAPRRRELTNALARLFVHSMTILYAQFAFGTVATHAVARWKTTGGIVADGLTPVPYPDDRYLTTMMWWDRASFADHADPAQLPRILAESAQLTDDRVVRRGLAMSAS